MRKAEQRLWDTMRQRLSGVPMLNLKRVENIVEPGFPDVYFRAERQHGWVELKAPKTPKRASTPLLGCSANHELTIQQQNFLLVCSHVGIPAYVLIRDDNKNIFMIEAKLAKQINKMTVTELLNNTVTSTWDGIIKELTK